MRVRRWILGGEFANTYVAAVNGILADRQLSYWQLEPRVVKR